jgi:TRAP-type C4-dicarboxylate transport system substrate-binding protein
VPEKQQQAIMEAAKAAQAHERQLFVEDEQRLAADLKAKGMQFVEVDKKAFADKGRDAVVAALNPEVRPLYEGIVAA